MKYLKLILSRVALCTAILYCMTPLSPAALATEQAGDTHEISIEVNFDESDRVYTEQDYQDVAFVVLNSRNEYLVAEYDPTIGAYVPTGSTGNVTEATRFRCSWKDTSSGVLMIVGLEDNCYTLINWEVPSGFRLYEYDITVWFTQTSAFVDGHIVEGYDGQTLQLYFHTGPGFKLPRLEYYDPAQQIIATIGAFVGALLSYILIRCLKPDSEKSQE